MTKLLLKALKFAKRNLKSIIFICIIKKVFVSLQCQTNKNKANMSSNKKSKKINPDALRANKTGYDIDTINMLYSKTMTVVGTDVPKNISMLLQACGNLGAFFNSVLSKETDIILVNSMDSITVSDIIDASKNAAIFTFDEILSYINGRLDLYPDSSTEFYINKYNQK